MMVPSSWTVCAMPLDRVRIGFLRPIAEAVLVEQRVGAAAAFGERQAAQRAHEGDRLARVHRRIEAALLGQIADLRRRLERAVVAEHAARSARRVDDPEQHPQGGRLAGAVGAEQAVDRAGRNGEADAVDRARLVEILDQVDGFDGEAVRRSVRAEPVEALIFLKKSRQAFDKLRPSGVVVAWLPRALRKQ